MIDLGRVLKELKVTGFVFHNSDVVGNPKTEKEFNSMFGKFTGVKDDTSIVSTNPSDFGVTWKQVSDKMKELEAAEPMRLLRVERDRLLSECDWWASSDLTITDAQKKYRQDLRDITKSATSLDDVTWPSKP